MGDLASASPAGKKMLGCSAAMRSLFHLINKVAQSSCNVLIHGESGTGKELVARAIHQGSARADRPFVAINCAAIPDGLLESELFGHAKGAFTGASERRRGLFEEADKGTLFLDEIGDMPLALQSKLLRFLQERTIKAVGENSYRTINVRVIAATHKSLEKAVGEGLFREDLYYRLCVAPVEVPPLRERRDDIPVLAIHFLETFNASTSGRIAGFTELALSKLGELAWPGNVRELENVIERAVTFCESSWIGEDDISFPPAIEPSPSASDLFSRLMTLENLEREYIEYVLARMGNRREKAARILGVNRKTLYRKQLSYSAVPHVRAV